MSEGTYGPALGTAAAPIASYRLRGPLATNFVWLVASNVAYAACQWGAVVALAKFAPPAALGYFGLALAVTNPIVLTTGLSLKAYQSTDVLGRYRFSDYVNLRLATNLVSGALIAAVAVIGLVSGPAAAVLIPVAVAKLSDATSETCYGLAQKHDRMRFVAISKTARGALGLAALAAVVILGGSVSEGAWALAAAWTIYLLLIDLRMAASLEPILGRPQLAVLWRLVRETAPLGGVCGVIALTQSVPRFLLQLTQGAAAVGYYTALAALGTVLSHLAGAAGNAAAPRLGWAVASDTARYRGLVRSLLGISAVASLVLVLLALVGGDEFLRLAYTEDYGAYWSTFLLIALAAGFGIVNTVVYFALVAVRRLTALLAIQSVGLVVTAVAGAVLIPTWGLDGAAFGAVVGTAVMAAIGVRALVVRGASR
ncbi:MAG TPA: oligosaccharide flippase family protein [Candidatus Binatia bacterium]|nr:oligosaccharide flippase family protein [Candidatus Binatia bacterium]